MKQNLQITAIFLMLLALSSCSRVYLVEAVFVDGRLTFISEDDKETNPPWCWSDFALIGDNGAPVWKFEVPYSIWENKDRCGPNFPLAYGFAPSQAEISVPPQRLQFGQVYVIVGSSGGLLEGAFFIYKVADRIILKNLDPKSPEVQSMQADYFERL